MSAADLTIEDHRPHSASITVTFPDIWSLRAAVVAVSRQLDFLGQPDDEGSDTYRAKRALDAALLDKEESGS